LDWIGEPVGEAVGAQVTWQHVDEHAERIKL
jgi:hypothetical protein